MAIEKAPEGYGITGKIEGSTKWYPGPPVGEGGRTVSVSMSRGLFDRLTTAAKVEGKTLGCVARKAVGNYIKRCQQDPGFRQEVEDLAIRLDRYGSNPNPRESK